MTCFSPPPPCVDLVGPDGSWEDGAGHRGGVRLQAGVAPPGGGALVSEISLDRRAGEVDPRAAAWGHQPGGEQEPHHVGHPIIHSSLPAASARLHMPVHTCDNAQLLPASKFLIVFNYNKLEYRLFLTKAFAECLIRLYSENGLKIENKYGMSKLNLNLHISCG